MLCFTVRNYKLVAARKPLPRLKRGWALIRVRLAGICNTDVEILRGYHQFRGTPGHEFVGEVVKVAEVSAKTQKRWLGKRVAGEINVACSAYGYKPVCAFCRRGLKTHCARRTVLGIVAHDGAFAEYLALPLENLHVVPKNVSDAKAVFIEPLAAACQILDQLNIREFPTAAVLGDGKLAQLIALVLQAAGTRVVLYGKHANKLAYARKAGIATKKVRGDAGDLRRVKEDLSSRHRSHRLTHRLDSRAAHDGAARHAAPEIHIPRRGACGNLAHRGKGNHRGRFALRPLR